MTQLQLWLLGLDCNPHALPWNYLTQDSSWCNKTSLCTNGSRGDAGRKISKAKGPKEHWHIGKCNTRNVRRTPFLGSQLQKPNNYVKPQSNQREVSFELNKKGILPTLKTMRSDTREFRDNSKYCEYHQDIGHHIGKCKTLAVSIKQEEVNDKSGLWIKV